MQTSSIVPVIGAGLLLYFLTRTGVDTEGKRVLIVGDSLSVGPLSFGGRLKKTIEKGGASSVSLVAVGGASARSIQRQPLFISASLKEYDVAFILLGTNDAANVSVGADFQSVVSSFAQLKTKITTDRLVGCGSQAFGQRAQDKYKGINFVAASLNESIDSLFYKFVSLYSITEPFGSELRTKDGVHFTSKGYELMTDKFVEAL